MHHCNALRIACCSAEYCGRAEAPPDIAMLAPQRERLFSALSLVLNKQRSSLCESLEQRVRLMQQVYTIDTFLWAVALEEWHSGARVRGRYVNPT
jgi:hypothetical protein